MNTYESTDSRGIHHFSFYGLLNKFLKFDLFDLAFVFGWLGRWLSYSFIFCFFSLGFFKAKTCLFLNGRLNASCHEFPQYSHSSIYFPYHGRASSPFDRRYYNEIISNLFYPYSINHKIQTTDHPFQTKQLPIYQFILAIYHT